MSAQAARLLPWAQAWDPAVGRGAERSWTPCPQPSSFGGPSSGAGGREEGKVSEKVEIPGARIRAEERVRFSSFRSTNLHPRGGFKKNPNPPTARGGFGTRWGVRHGGGS